MNEKFSGKVWVLGDDIDTDIIIPTEYLALKTVEEPIEIEEPGDGILWMTDLLREWAVQGLILH